MVNWAKWLPVIGLSLLMIALQIIGPENLRYETRALSTGQLWRVFSAHLVHANWIHLALNLAGFMLCVAITGVNWKLWQWGWRILLLSLGISSGFYVLHPDIGWYVGFSGVLFGLYVLAAYATLSQQLFMSVVLWLFIALKIGMEQWSSVKITSSELIGVPVLVDAHLYGVLLACGIIAVTIILLKLKTQAKHD